MNRDRHRDAIPMDSGVGLQDQHELARCPLCSYIRSPPRLPTQVDTPAGVLNTPKFSMRYPRHEVDAIRTWEDSDEHERLATAAEGEGKNVSMVRRENRGTKAVSGGL